MTLSILSSSLAEAATINSFIPEFESPYKEQDFLSRCDKKDHISLVAKLNDEVVGFIVAYNRDNDGSLYLWMAGVKPAHRKLGAMQKLLNSLETWATKNAYSSITVKTRNKHKQMIRFLVKNGFDFTYIEPRDDILDSRLRLVKKNYLGQL